jgi:hypothetical protein
MTEKKEIIVTADPENPNTVILSSWPTARQKTKALKAQVAEITKADK